MVFEGKNKAYGAYEMRQTSPSRHNKATIIVMIFVLDRILASALLKIVVPKQEKEVMTEVTELTNLEAPEEKTEEIKKPDPSSSSSPQKLHQVHPAGDQEGRRGTRRG